MKLGKQDYLCIKDPATCLGVARQQFECCGGHNAERPCLRTIQRGDLYVEHRGSVYHVECAIQHGLVERAPIRQCPHCHKFIWRGQPHADTCPTTGSANNQQRSGRAAGASG
jgi:hypothetical protein